MNELKHLRPITKEENATLRDLLLSLPVPRKRILKAALNTAVFSVFSLAGFCIFWFMASLILSAFINVDIGISSDYASSIFIFACIAAFLIAINSTKTWLANTVDDYGLVAEDLNVQKTQEIVYIIQSVKCFKEPEYGGLLYFLLLTSIEPSANYQRPKNKLPNQAPLTDSNAKIRAIYDYESQNAKMDPKNLIEIKERLTIAFAPCSQFVFANKFTGILFDNITYHELNALPENWPDADSWYTGEWDKLVSIYS